MSSRLYRTAKIAAEIAVPIALVAGTTMFLATERRNWQQFGRILVGVGLLVLSLQLRSEQAARFGA